MIACTTDISTPAGAPVLTAVTPDFPEMEVLGDGPQQPAAPAAADHDHYYSSVDDLAMDMANPQQPAARASAVHDHYYSSADDLAMDMANPQQPAARASAVHDHYYSSADDLAMDMADPQLGSAVVVPVEVSGLSGHVSICLSAEEMSVLNNVCQSVCLSK